MGQAKAKRREYEQALASLITSCDAEDATVATSAIRLHDNFIRPRKYTGGCYMTTFVLHSFLKREHGIETFPVVGYVNDGTDDIMISHAWLEHRGRKTDLTLYLLEHGDRLSNGALLVLDHPIRSGKAEYSYHSQPTQQGLREMQRMMGDPGLQPVLVHKEEEHRKMVAISKSAALIDAYLKGAPPELSYEVMAAIMRR